MSTAGPEVSVCVPVYRGEAFLAETIHSVLSQTFEDFELVLLDNASTDETPHIARSFGDPRLRIVTNATTLSQPDNWRRAVELCRAPLVKLVCADDLLFHLSYLADAVALGRPELLVAYVEFIARFLGRFGVAEDEVDATLAALRAATARRTSPATAAAAAACLDAAEVARRGARA